MNIMIVDDEVEIREGLRCMIEQLADAARYSVVAVCAGASDALEAMSRQAVDVLLTDIKMSRMDGLTLAETAKRLYSPLQVIILSGYSRFEYAQQAIKLDVGDYLLKPVHKEELEAALAKQYAGWTERRETRIYADFEQFGLLMTAYGAVIVLDGDGEGERKKQDLADKEPGSRWAEGETAKADCRGSAPDEEPVAVMSEPTQRTEQSLPGAIKEAVCGMAGAFLLKGYAAVGVGAAVGLCGETEDAVRRSVGKLVAAAERYADRSGRQIGIGISDIGKGREYVHSLYLHACTALAGRIVGGSGSRTYAPAVFDESEFRIDLGRIEASWDTLDFAAIEAEAGRLTESAAERGAVGILMWTINTIMLFLNDKVKTFNHLNEHIPYDQSAFLFKILWCRNRDELTALMVGRVHSLLCHTSPEKREGHMIRKAKQMIRQRLHEQLALADIGREVCVSASYLSRLFREQTGTTFIEYLTAERIGRAKELLSDPGIKVYEVAEQVGYGSWKHFSRTFKDQTGRTPAEYRQNVQVGN